jgi:hypothetical protein
LIMFITARRIRLHPAHSRQCIQRIYEALQDSIESNRQSVRDSQHVKDGFRGPCDSRASLSSWHRTTSKWYTVRQPVKKTPPRPKVVKKPAISHVVTVPVAPLCKLRAFGYMFGYGPWPQEYQRKRVNEVHGGQAEHQGTKWFLQVFFFINNEYVNDGGRPKDRKCCTQVWNDSEDTFLCFIVERWSIRIRQYNF